MSTKKSKTLMINDIMTSFKNKFVLDLSPEESEDSVFEKLAAYLVTCKYSSDYEFSLQDICSGQSDTNAGSEMSVDSAAVVVNGYVVPNVEYLESIADSLGDKINVSYVLTQSKNEEHFSDLAGKYGKFITGVNAILRAQEPIKGLTKTIDNFIEIKNVIESGQIIVDEKPKAITIDGGIKVNTCYVISGSEKNKERSLGGAKKHIENNISNLEAAGNYVVDDSLIIGYETLRKIYDDVFMGADAQFNMRTLSPFEMDNISKHGIDAIYTGYLPFKEYKKVIQDEDGDLRPNVFSENVRGYLDKTHINKSIKESLASGGALGEGDSESIGRDLFFAMNNGVTIIAKHLQSGLGTGNTMRLQGYQVVNGCQTSHILHEYYTDVMDKLNKIREDIPEKYLSHEGDDLKSKILMDCIESGMGKEAVKEAVDDLLPKVEAANKYEKEILGIESSICVPVRIIHTRKDSVIDLIIASTNTQNPVNELVLLSRSEFNKKLENYFAGHYEGSLRYERRKNQYVNSMDSINSKITMDDLLKAYASIFLKSPHESARYFGKLKKRATSKTPSVFSEGHNCDSYYLAARIYVDLDAWLRENQILSEYRRYRWHMMYAVAEIIDREAGRENKKANKILGRNMSFDQSAPKMKEVLDRYIKIHESDNGTKINDIFSEAKKSIDKAIKTMQRRGVQLNEINKDAEFHKEIYKNIVK